MVRNAFDCADKHPRWQIPLAADSDAFDTLQATATESHTSRKYAIQIQSNPTSCHTHE